MYTAVVFTCQDPNLYWGIMILAGIVGGFVPSVIWQATPDTVEPDDVPAANSLVAFTQNFGMFLGAIFMGNAITAFGWSTGSYVSLVPCYIVCLVIFFVTGAQVAALTAETAAGEGKPLRREGEGGVRLALCARGFRRVSPCERASRPSPPRVTPAS